MNYSHDWATGGKLFHDHEMQINPVEDSGVNLQAIWVQEGSFVHLGSNALSLPEQPTRAAIKGDFVVIYVRRAGIYVGHVTDERNTLDVREALNNLRNINLKWFFGARWTLPRGPWNLFSAQPQFIADGHQVVLLNEVVNGTHKVNSSSLHILFDELVDRLESEE